MQPTDSVRPLTEDQIAEAEKRVTMPLARYLIATLCAEQEARAKAKADVLAEREERHRLWREVSAPFNQEREAAFAQNGRFSVTDLVEAVASLRDQAARQTEARQRAEAQRDRLAAALREVIRLYQQHSAAIGLRAAANISRSALREIEGGKND